MWGVLVSIIFCVSWSNSLSLVSSIKFWVPFLFMPSAPVTTAIVLILSFKIFVTSISRSLYLESFWNSLREIFFICWKCNIYHDACIFFEICYLMSGRFASIFLSALIVKSLRIVTSVFSVTGCGVSPYHFSVWGRQFEVLT